MQLVVELRPVSPSTKQREDEVLELVVNTETGEGMLESIRSARKRKRCVVEVATDFCLRWRMRQSLSDMVVAQKPAARKSRSSLLKYDFTARKAGAESVTEVGEELRSQSDEARVETENERVDDVWFAWSMKPIDDSACSG